MIPLILVKKLHGIQVTLQNFYFTALKLYAMELVPILDKNLNYITFFKIFSMHISWNVVLNINKYI